MKRILAYTLEVLPGVIFILALSHAELSLHLPILRHTLVEMFITILGVLLGFWSVTVSARIPRGVEKRQEETKVIKSGRFIVAYTLVCCIVVSLVAYLWVETNWGVISLLVSGGAFYMGLCMFLIGYLVESGIVDWE